MNDYDKQYYTRHRPGALQSARSIVPKVLALTGPKSVVDFGCGDGSWLSVFREHGITRILGIDGPWIQPEELQIPAREFQEADLQSPFRVDKRFDLVVSLEVAEHLPEKSADTFVESLVSAGKVILFSAAVPNQGGLHHVNEQWPTYWQEKFASRGYVCVDCLRPYMWEDPTVDWWYAQNILLYVKREAIHDYPSLQKYFPGNNNSPVSIAHPMLIEELSKRREEVQSKLTQAEARSQELSRTNSKLESRIDELADWAEDMETINSRLRALDPAFYSILDILTAVPKVSWRAIRRRLGRLPRRD